MLAHKIMYAASENLPALLLLIYGRKCMDTMGEQTLESVQAFTTLKIEMGWGLHRINSKLYTRHLAKEEKNAVTEIGLLN